jgi:tetratricopeptide (TPR) repeat protein
MIIFFLSLSKVQAAADIAWEKYKDFQVEEYRQLREFKERKQDLDHLLQAKKSIIDGELILASHFLNRIDHRGKSVALVKLRYQALIAFVQDEYAKVIDILSDNRFFDVTTYPEICMLKVISYMALKRDPELRGEFATCRTALFNHSPNELQWPFTLYQAYKRERNILDATDLTQRVSYVSDKESSIIWLKTALVTNREDKIAHLLSEIPGEAYQSHRVRELIGMLYYRLGNYPKAVEFIEDIHTPNAANIRGNIHYGRGEFELAWGHFKLALKYKEDSVNAIERALPLTWMLGQWNDGLDALSKLLNPNVDIKKKLALNTALQVKLNNFKRASRQMEQIKELYRGEIPQDASVMYAYIALRNEELDKFTKYSLQACKQGDGLSCWMTFANHYWENLPRTIKRTDSLIESKKLEAFKKLRSEEFTNVIDESVIIDEKDIIELDTQEIGLKLQ